MCSAIGVECGAGQVVIVWEGKTGQALHRLMGHTEPVFGLDFSPDGVQLCSGGYDNQASTLVRWGVGMSCVCAGNRARVEEGDSSGGDQ